MKHFADCGVSVPDILLPAKKELSTWCVVACDQYTQDPAYWEKAAAAVGAEPSTLSLILPELYLSKPGCKERIQDIRRTMVRYLSDGTFDPPAQELIYVERTTGYGRTRKGLVCAIDLDSYDWRPGASSLVRATEATIVERIPPRKEIRMGAPLESPHIMLLVDDPDRTLVEAAGLRARRNPPVYDGNLMMGAGRVTGWALSSDEDTESVHGALTALVRSHRQSDGSSFLFAVGDGNHSLATAKAVWEEYRDAERKRGASEAEISRSPVRYALVEVVNIYDEALTFEPIHRVLFNADADALSRSLCRALGGTASRVQEAKELSERVGRSSADFGIISRAPSGEPVFTLISTQLEGLAVSRLQPALDSFAEENGGVSMDYIHGSDEVFRLGLGGGAVALLLPPVRKDSFFSTISARGPLPRKSFSMGEASEKRFYLECRELFSGSRL